MKKKLLYAIVAFWCLNISANSIWARSSKLLDVTSIVSATGRNASTDIPGCAMTVNITAQNNLLCAGEDTGSATVEQLDGTAPFTYLWNDDNAQTTATATGLKAGNYSVTVTDADGCTAVTTVVITEPTLPLTAFTSEELVYEETFVNGQTYCPGDPNYDNWTSFRNNIDTSLSYTSITLSGSELIADISCSDPVAVNQIAKALATGTAVSVAVDGNIWNVGLGCRTGCNIEADAVELNVNNGGGCSCGANPTLRPAIGNGNWGGFGSGACGAVTQSMKVTLVSTNLKTNDVSCNGGNDGIIELDATGGNVPYSYSWSNGATTSTISGLEAGTYNVTVTDANGCTSTSTVTINEPDVLEASATETKVSCNGGADGAIDLQVTGGTAPYTYLWSNEETVEDLEELTAGTYEVTVTDANGCTAKESIAVTEPLPINPNEVLTHISCEGSSDGSISLNPTEGTAPYSYYWKNVTEVILGAQGFEENTGTWNYTLDPTPYNTQGESTITDGNPGTHVWGKVEAFNHYAKNSPSEGSQFFGAQATNNTNGGGDFFHTITFDAFDVSAYGELILEFDYSTLNYSSGYDIQYVVAYDNADTWADPIPLITNTNGIWEKLKINVPATAQYVRLRLQIKHSGDYQYAAFDNVMLYEEGPAPENSVTGLAAGTYDVVITDILGCSVIESFEILEPSVLTASALATNVSCNSGSNGAIDLTINGGTTPYTYKWNNSATTEDITGLKAGTYSVLVTDARGCTANASVTVTEPTKLVASAINSDVTCNGGNDGTIDLSVTGGFEPYTFTWNTTATSKDIKGLTAGTYSVTVTDANGCTATESIEVSEPKILELSTLVDTNVACNGGATGSITMNLTGGTAPFDYTINATTYSGVPDATLTLSGFAAATYAISIKDANGCTASGSATITEPTALSASIVATDVTCNSGSNGTVDLTVSGGTAPYTFDWSNTATTEDLTGLKAGKYSVTVTDANGCTVNVSVDVLEPAMLTASATATNVFCNGGSDGTVDLTVSGGVAPYIFSWNNTATTEDMVGLKAGTYKVLVTDANGCTTTQSVEVLQPTELVASAIKTNVICNGGNNGSIDLTVTGGTAPYSYAWNNSATTEDMTGLSAAIYRVTVTDANGCTVSRSVNIAEPDALTATSITTAASCKGSNDGTIDLTVTGGTAPYTYAWDNTATTEDLAALTVGTYKVTITDVNGCSATAEATVVNGDDIAPIPDAVSLDPILTQCEVLEADVIAPTATDNCKGAVTVTNDAVFPISTQGATTITWTFTDELGNSATQTQEVVIEDVTAPKPDMDVLAEVTMECQVLESDVPAPSATDNCGGSVTVSHDATFPITDLGTTVITWTYTDAFGNAETQTQNITVVESPLAKVTFDDATLTYNGSVQTIEIANLPSEASVTYSVDADTEATNGATDAGTYIVTAVVTPPSSAVNCSSITRSATLTIDKAPQTITFDALEVVSLEDDEDFQLEASASSGLPVAYTYTHTAAIAPAEVSETGFVTLQTSGTVDITVAQPGNANYLPATPVLQTLQINSRDASAHSVTIESEVYDNPSEEIYYLIDCDEDLIEVVVSFETEANAVAVPGKEIVINTPKPGMYYQQVEITSQDESTVQTYNVVVEKRFPFTDIVKQKFDNVLLVNNNPDNNGGYSFVAYAWYKDGAVVGNGQYYSAGPNSGDRLDTNASYRVEMTTEDGEVLQTCVASITSTSSFSASIFPNPNVSGNMLQIDVTDYQVSAESSLNVKLFSVHGSLVSEWDTDTQNTTVQLPQNLDSGVYVISCKAGNQIRNFKLIIE
ncbi:MAG: T9SS type A sorting domain-containing protein [Leeuwenhoekiella sp.]